MFLGAFLISLVLQVSLEYYQSIAIFTPLTERTGNIQVISQFLNHFKGTMKIYEEYRWEYGDVASFVRQARERQLQDSAYLSRIQTKLPVIGKDQYLLASAIKDTFRSYTDIHEQICSLLIEGENSEAATLYYEKFTPCASYLSAYTQQLLVQAITDNQHSYTKLMALNGRFTLLQNIFLGLVVALGTVLVSSLLGMIRSVQEMSRRSIEIGDGLFDTPDVDASHNDEIGDLAKAFNSMKHSMKRQVGLLEEKNQMESELYQKENEALGLQNLLETQKLQVFRSQVNPHFLFNTLNVLMYNAQEEHAPVTERMLRSLSQIYRYATGNNKAQVPLSRELNIVKAYASLCEARFGDKMKFTLHLPSDTDVTEVLVPSFIIQPLVENAFKHGLTPKEDAGSVVVDIKTHEGMLFIIVSDDGVGICPQTLGAVREKLKNPTADGEHIGLSNVASRLALLSRKSSITIDSQQAKGTTVELRLPLIVASDPMHKEGDEE